MGIINRLSRIGRAEVSDLKRQLRETSSNFDQYGDDLSYASDVASAEAELARHLDGDPVGRAWEAQLYGQPAPSYHTPSAPLAPTGDSEMDRGASLWGAPPASTTTAPAPAPRAPASESAPLAPGWVQDGAANPWAAPAATPTPTAKPTVTPASTRQEPFPREVREAYATLEIPLGSDRTRIDESFRSMINRYHPDRFNGQPERIQAAQELTQRLTEARNYLFQWLEGRL